MLASSSNPLLFEAARVATGVSSLIPVIANCAEVVEVPPIPKSKVSLIGDSSLLVNCQ